MDDNAKHASSYQVDQEILEARGINMTVEEVAGLPTCKYSQRVQSMKLNDEDRAFLKGLRRRIKNRLASQNSRRRSVEHLRRLTRELRAVRACRSDALADRRALQARRDTVRDKCTTLRRHLVQILQARSDVTEVPSIEVELPPLPPKESSIKKGPARDKSPLTHLSECFKNNETDKIKQEINFEEDDDVYEKVRQELQKEKEQYAMEKDEPVKDMSLKRKLENFDNIQTNILNCSAIKKELDKNIFECKIGKLVQQSVNHIFNDKKKVFAKTVFIANEKMTSNVKSITFNPGNEEVLNLSVKEGARRKSHGRKQSAPRRITYCTLNDDGVLDLKIKKESQ